MISFVRASNSIACVQRNCAACGLCVRVLSHSSAPFAGPHSCACVSPCLSLVVLRVAFVRFSWRSLAGAAGRRPPPALEPPQAAVWWSCARARANACVKTLALPVEEAGAKAPVEERAPRASSGTVSTELVCARACAESQQQGADAPRRHPSHELLTLGASSCRLVVAQRGRRRPLSR